MDQRVSAGRVLHFVNLYIRSPNFLEQKQQNVSSTVVELAIFNKFVDHHRPSRSPGN
jgi:hypothetical protein